jgi:hypothetical protein
MKAFALILGAGLVALGCQKSEPPAPLVASAAPSAAPVASAAAAPTDSAAAVDSAVPVATAAAPVAAAAKVPTEADYEVQAQSAITPTNAAQVLTAIEKQVGQ